MLRKDTSESQRKAPWNADTKPVRHAFWPKQQLHIILVNVDILDERGHIGLDGRGREGRQRHRLPLLLLRLRLRLAHELVGDGFGRDGDAVSIPHP